MSSVCGCCDECCVNLNGRFRARWCKTCILALCPDCALDNHRQHSMELLNLAANNRKQEIKIDLERSREMMSEVQTRMGTIEHQMDESERLNEDIRKRLGDGKKAIEMLSLGLYELMERLDDTLYQNLNKHIYKMQQKTMDDMKELHQPTQETSQLLEERAQTALDNITQFHKKTFHKQD